MRLEPGGPAAPESGVPPFEFYEPARYAMGDTRRLAERMRLIEMEPRRDATSTGYALVNDREEYLVLEPAGDGAPFTVELGAGRYSLEWFSVTAREPSTADAVTVPTAGATSFTAPFDGPAVLYLKAR